MSGEPDALRQLKANVSSWAHEPYSVAYKVLEPREGGKDVPIVMRWSQPQLHRPVPSSYATITAAMHLQPDGRSWTSQYKLEHELYVYSEEEMAKLCAKLVARTVASKERLADILDVVEPFEASRLPKSYPDDGAKGTTAEMAALAEDEAAHRSATLIQAVARGRAQRRLLAEAHAQRASTVEQEVSAVRIQEEGGSVWTDDEAKAAMHIQRVARGKLARRRVAGLKRGGETIAVRVSGAAAAAEQARAGDLERLKHQDAQVAAEEQARERERAAKEEAAIRIQAIARGRAARRAQKTAKHLTGRAAAMAAVQADVSGSKRAERAAEGIVAAQTDKENTAAAKIQALHRGRKDLEWPLGALMAQACHASIAAIEESRSDDQTAAYVAKENIAHMHKVVYEAKSAAALESTAAKLKQRGASHYRWIEQPEGIATAIALKPYPRSLARAFCKGLRLFK